MLEMAACPQNGGWVRINGLLWSSEVASSIYNDQLTDKHTVTPSDLSPLTPTHWRARDGSSVSWGSLNVVCLLVTTHSLVVKHTPGSGTLVKLDLWGHSHGWPPVTRGKNWDTTQGLLRQARKDMIAIAGQNHPTTNSCCKDAVLKQHLPQCLSLSSIANQMVSVLEICKNTTLKKKKKKRNLEISSRNGQINVLKVLKCCQLIIYKIL